MRAVQWRAGAIEYLDDRGEVAERREVTERGAVISADRSYRYLLFRRWGDGASAIAWVMLNPSLADDREEDPTSRRVVTFSAGLGADRAYVANLYAWRSPDPASLKGAPDPVGPGNWRAVSSLVAAAAAFGWPLVFAWGAPVRFGSPSRAHPALCAAERKVWRIARRRGIAPLCYGVTQNGHPKHPLYLPIRASLRPWEGPRTRWAERRRRVVVRRAGRTLERRRMKLLGLVD